MNLVFSSLLLVAGVVAAKQGLQDSTSTAAPATAEVMICHLTMECVSQATQVGAQRKQHHHNECSPVVDGVISDYSYPIELSSDFVDENKADLIAGKLFVAIPGGKIVNGAVIYPFNSQITISSIPDSFKTRHRRLADTTGTKSILVLRISANDATPDFSASQIYSYIFDNSQPDSDPSLTSQYSRLSFGKLSFVPTQYGVIEVPVSLNANGADISTIRDAAIDYVTSHYSVSSVTDLADHVIFCIPPGTGDWAGSSPVVSWRMVLNNQWCGYLSGLMHEMGHNIGLLHSNKDDVQYMDYTSYMSAGYATPYYPMKSFNGANNAQLGWYSDRAVTVDPTQGGQIIKLATFVDYGKSNTNDPVLIKVGTDVFLQYNKAKDFNRETQLMIDQVTIVQQLNSGTSLLGGVDPSGNPQYTISNLDGTGRDVVIYACSSGDGGDNDNPDWMTISIGYDQSYCVEGAQFAPPAPTTTTTTTTVTSETAAPTIAVAIETTTTAPTTAPIIASETTPSPTIATTALSTASPTIAETDAAVATSMPTIAVEEAATASPTWTQYKKAKGSHGHIMTRRLRVGGY